MKKDLSVLPIGVIDSGIGGLVVLKELTIKFPSESFIYLGDNGNKFKYDGNFYDSINNFSASSIVFPQEPTSKIILPLV